MISVAVAVLGAYWELPLYAAVIVCGLAEAGSVEVEKLACPFASTGTFAARIVLPSWKVTVPLVSGAPPAVRVAVKLAD
jgi:hypothetical protein